MKDEETRTKHFAPGTIPLGPPNPGATIPPNQPDKLSETFKEVDRTREFIQEQTGQK